MKWYGHILRREDEYVGKRVMVMEVPGKEREEDQIYISYISPTLHVAHVNITASFFKLDIRPTLSEKVFFPNYC